VSWATADASATAGSDYLAATGTVTFAAGQTSATITVLVLGDTLHEPDETFTVVLSSPVGLTIGTGTATVTITNDDAAPVMPTVSLTATDGSAAEAGADAGAFTITRSVELAGSIVVLLTWAGTATYGSDYTVSASGGTLAPDRSTITIPDGLASVTIIITPIDDTAAEPAETLTLTLATGTGYTTIEPTSGTVAIADDDLPTGPTISIADLTVTESDKGTKSYKIAVTLSAASTSPITVSFATVAGTATASADFTATSGTLTFAPGVTTQYVTVKIVGDRTVESTETFAVVLSNPVGATLADDSGTVTITDNERRLTASEAGPGSAARLTVADAQPVLAAALEDLRAIGADVDALGTIELRVEALAGLELAEVDGTVIVVDTDAAGWGWSTDLATVEPDQMDLYSALLHELGHLLGFEHDAAGVLRDVMGPRLAPGVRVVLLGPTPAAASLGNAQSGAGAPSGSSRSAAASSNQNRAPSPGTLSAPTDPPWASMIALTIERPRPEAPVERSRAGSAW
jgi:hypothetical protein